MFVLLRLEWTLRSIFGSNIAQSCPLSSLTNVYVDLQLSQVDFFRPNKFDAFLFYVDSYIEYQS